MNFDVIVVEKTSFSDLTTPLNFELKRAKKLSQNKIPYLMSR